MNCTRTNNINKIFKLVNTTAEIIACIPLSLSILYSWFTIKLFNLLKKIAINVNSNSIVTIIVVTTYSELILRSIFLNTSLKASSARVNRSANTSNRGTEIRHPANTANNADFDLSLVIFPSWFKFSRPFTKLGIPIKLPTAAWK